MRRFFFGSTYYSCSSDLYFQKVVFELPVAEATDRERWSERNSNSVNVAPPPSSVSSQTQTTPRPTFPPTFKPTPFPIESTGQPIEESPATSPITPRPTRQQGPTSAPFGKNCSTNILHHLPCIISCWHPRSRRIFISSELSDITIYNDGGTVVINAASSFTDENIVVTQSTTLMLEEGGYIEAPLNTDWPAIRWEKD